jgi:hypothetical protein
MKALRQQVERVVRPVRASQATKDRMREDLLEHLQLLYGKELARSGDPVVALAEATRQLGEPQALTRDLQSRVSRLERWAMTPLAGTQVSRRRPGESVGRWIVRTVTVGSLASGVALAVIVFLLAALRMRVNRLGPVWPFLLTNPILMWVSLVSMFWCCELIRRQVEIASQSGKRFSRALRIAGLVIAAIAIAELAPVVVIGMIWRLSPHPFVTTQEAAIVCLVWAGIMLAIFPIQARDWIVAMRRYERWGSLELNDPAE